MNEIHYCQRVSHNKKIIKNLTESDYPFLYAFLHHSHDKMQNRLFFLFDLALNTPNQQMDRRGGWMSCTLQTMADKAAQKGLSRSKKTWASVIDVFIWLGLILRNIPTEKTASTPYEKKAVALAKEQGHQRATPHFCIPEYTPNRLNDIEERLKKWEVRGGNFTDFTKTTIIDVDTHKEANRTYQSGYGKPYYKTDREMYLIDTLSWLLSQNPFTTKKELFEVTTELHPISPGAAKRTWDRRHDFLLMCAMAWMHKPTKEEKELYQLTSSAYIITRAPDMPNAVEDLSAHSDKQESTSTGDDTPNR